MRKMSVYLVLCFFLLSSIFLPGCSSAKDNLELTIVHTNDVHGRAIYSEDDEIVGYSKFNTKINSLKESNPNLILMDAGDTLHGQTFVTVPEGETAVKIMNLMGYNYFTPGNHDFNYGYERLIELSKTMEFKILAANVVYEDGSLVFQENDIVEIDGVKIGFFGLATPETTVKTNPVNVEGLEFKDPVETAKEQVEKLQNDGATLIILLSHLGIDDESNGHRSYDVRDNVDGIDLIVDGHSHSDFDKISQVEGKAVITSTGAYGENLGIVQITIKDGEKSVVASTSSFEDLKNLETSSEIDEYVELATSELSPILNQVIGTTEVYLEGSKSKVRSGETNLTKIITDSIVDECNPDVVLLNGGSFRDSLNVGDITLDNIITVFPFGNYVVTKSVKGSDIVAALELGFSSYPEVSSAMTQVSGLQCVVDSTAEAGSRIQSVKINSEDIDLEKEYILATNDFIAEGGDGFDMIKDSAEVNQYSGLVEVICAYLEKISPITNEYVESLSSRISIK